MSANTGTDGFSEEERAAMKQRAAELKKEANRGRGNKAAADELDVLSKIAEMEPSDRAVAERIHAIVTANAPELAPKLWYGQPAYARKGKVVCFFRSGHVDKEPYSTFSFTSEANLADDSGLWPTSFAVTELSDEAAKTITALVKTAVR
ncbi:iron chaperone [Nonomuraea purpurea]|uniref:Iron chaperone n=1 Tax=Nonomuraea purpurea TaxID=1849276 RepID=A0ABV8GR28_9ACTN